MPSGIYQRDRAKARRLTPRQIDIVGLVAQGYMNREIAEAVGTTENVIKNYMRLIYDKTGMDNRVELALWYEAHKEPTHEQHQSSGLSR